MTDSEIRSKVEQVTLALNQLSAGLHQHGLSITVDAMRVKDETDLPLKVYSIVVTRRRPYRADVPFEWPWA